MASLTVLMTEPTNKTVVCLKINSLLTCAVYENLLLTACGAHQWQCDYGNCIELAKRCDGNIDCPEDMSDERNCPSKSISIDLSVLWIIVNSFEILK